ncbi:glycoside hydrolase family 25 protein [Streptomyces sp. NPDC001118]
MLTGIDVSSYQSTSYSTAGLSFVGIKVSEGLSYVNSKWVAQRATARAAGLVTIFYHYPHIANSPAAEADYFLAQINLVAGDVLCLDWEWYGQSVTDQQARDYKTAWLAYVKAKAPGHRVIVYADRNNWLNVDNNSNAGDGLWIADYVTAGQPRVQDPWVFHQYSDQPQDMDVANFATVDALRAWAGTAGSGGGSTGAEFYPGASKAHWYSTAYPGDPMQVNTIVWHSTETTVLPDYSGGSIAPTLTAVPNWSTQRLDWYQHFGFDESARALVHAAGQMATNTLNVAQVEIVGTCDPTTHATWSKAGTQHLYMPELPDWAIRDLNAFAHWAHDQHGVPLTSGLTWKPYPASYGNNGVRMSTAAWSAFSGHCGHQHVPENDHGDPGQFPIAAILAAQPTPTTAPSEEDMPQWNSGTVVPGPQPTVALPPHGNAWQTAANRKLHLGMDQISPTPSKATVRVAIYDGMKWRLSTVNVTAAAGTVDVAMTATDEKVSLQTDAAGVAYAIESW